MRVFVILVAITTKLSLDIHWGMIQSLSSGQQNLTVLKPLTKNIAYLHLT